MKLQSCIVGICLALAGPYLPFAEGLIESDTATHTAVADGSWFSTTTWEGGEVPGEGAIAYVPEDISVYYDGSSEARLFAILVEGEFTISADNGGTTKLYVDTLFGVSESSIVVDGSDSTDGTIEVVFDPFDINDWKTSGATGWNDAAKAYYVDGALVYRHDGTTTLDDVEGVYGRFTKNTDGTFSGFDPDQLSIGFITMGSAYIRGQDKKDFIKLAEDAEDGDGSIVLSEDPVGWEVGDTIDVTGTEGGRWRSSTLSGTQDEIVTITSIVDKTVSFSPSLQYDHIGTCVWGKVFKAYVSNLTRNITFRSAHPDTISMRGHVMFMHNPDVDVRHAAFVDLGRTNKAKLLDDTFYTVSQNDDDDWVFDGPRDYDDDSDPDVRFWANPDEIENQRGRYAFHFHKMGTHAGADQAVAIGNVVQGSPGWGMVHHDSNALMEDNVVLMARGCGMVAESGSETGAWINNLSSSNRRNAADFVDDLVGYDTLGDADFKRLSRHQIEDKFRGGDGYGLASRLVEMVGNVAATSLHGIKLRGRGSPADNFPNLGPLVDGFDPDAFPIDAFPLNDNSFDGRVKRDLASFIKFEDNELYAIGRFALNSQDRDLAGQLELTSVVKNLSAWNSGNTMYLADTQTNYTFHNLISVDVKTGMSNQQATDITFVDSQFVRLEETHPLQQGDTAYDGQVFNFVNTTLTDVNGDPLTVDFINDKGGTANVLTDADVQDVPVTFTTNDNMDTTINLNTSDFTVVVDGTIHDSIGDDPFGGHPSEDESPDEREYDFDGKLDDYIAEYGAFTDSIGDYIILTEYIGDRVSGEHFGIDFAIDLIGYQGDTILIPTDDFQSVDWAGGFGWSGDWKLASNFSNILPMITEWNGNYVAAIRYGILNQRMTREFSNGIAGGTLTFKWDIDDLEDSEFAYAEVKDENGWHTVWTRSSPGNKSDLVGEADNLTQTTRDLSNYGTVTKVRFRLSSNTVGDDYLYVDDVDIR